MRTVQYGERERNAKTPPMMIWSSFWRCLGMRGPALGLQGKGKTTPNDGLEQFLGVLGRCFLDNGVSQWFIYNFVFVCCGVCSVWACYYLGFMCLFLFFGPYCLVWVI